MFWKLLVLTCKAQEFDMLTLSIVSNIGNYLFLNLHIYNLVVLIKQEVQLALTVTWMMGIVSKYVSGWL